MRNKQWVFFPYVLTKLFSLMKKKNIIKKKNTVKMDILGILKIEFHIEETPIADENNCDED